MPVPIQVGYIDLSAIPEGVTPLLLSLLPLQEKARLLQYRQPADRLRGAAGKLVLRALLQEQGYGPGILYHLQNDEYHRPFVDQRTDFNISHAGQIVVVALCEGGRIGIDVEERRLIRLSDFENFFTPAELEFIGSDGDYLTRFYELWTSKEAVMKANGKGMHLPVRKILLEGGKAWCEGDEWQLRQISLQDNYTCHLAMTEETTIITRQFTCVPEGDSYQVRPLGSRPDKQP